VVDAANQDLPARTTYCKSHIGGCGYIIDEILRREPVFSRLTVREQNARVAADGENVYTVGHLFRSGNNLHSTRLCVYSHTGEQHETNNCDLSCARSC
jgi:hypothetical protein